MKLRIAALALAVAFVAAPAFAVIARSACPPCADQNAGAPCSSFTAVSCCGDAGSTAPVKSMLDTPSVKAIADHGAASLVASYSAAPRARCELAARISPLRLSVVRRL
jgi:hypothetical protein